MKILVGAVLGVVLAVVLWPKAPAIWRAPVRPDIRPLVPPRPALRGIVVDKKIKSEPHLMLLTFRLQIRTPRGLVWVEVGRNEFDRYRIGDEFP